MIDARFELNAVAPLITDRRVQNGDLKSPYHKWHKSWQSPPEKYSSEFAAIVEHIRPMLQPKQEWQLEGIATLPAERPKGHEIGVQLLLGYHSTHPPRTIGIWPPQIQIDFGRVFTPEAQAKFTRGNKHDIIRRMESESTQIPGFLTEQQLVEGQAPANHLRWCVTNIDFSPFDFTDHRGWTLGEDRHRFIVAIDIVDAIYKLNHLSEIALRGNSQNNFLHEIRTEDLQKHIDSLKTTISRAQVQLAVLESKKAELETEKIATTTQNQAESNRLQSVRIHLKSLPNPKIRVSE